MTIVIDDGHAVAGCEYEPFGGIISATGEPSRIGHFGHHSYIHDRECDLYYLLSRYYDPGTGKFLNADTFASTGQGILGNNMFAYCLNNPINFHDQSGGLPVENDEYGANPMIYKSNNFVYAIPDLIQGEIERKQRERRAKNPFNTDIQAVLEAEHFAFYKGTLYVVVPIGQEAFSFGVVFMGDQVNNRSDAIATVQHEHGHSVHFSQIGPINYLNYVAIPSLLGYWTNVPTEEYYSQPYEYVADRFGNVQRTNNGMPYQYSKTTEEWWLAYWIFTAVAP